MNKLLYHGNMEDKLLCHTNVFEDQNSRILICLALKRKRQALVSISAAFISNKLKCQVFCFIFSLVSSAKMEDRRVE
jgi:hypothetical protein